MNLPSSLALPRSKFFQSRTGILVLALVAVVLCGGVFFALRLAAPPKSPTPATSPAAQLPARPAAPRVKPPIAIANDVHGPLSAGYLWKSQMPPAATAPPGTATLANPVPGAATRAGSVPAPAVPLTAPGVAATGAETPKSLEASVLFARDQYVYSSSGRRDPFLSLLDGKFQGSGDGSLIDVGDIHLVGIMWGTSDKFALVEDSRRRGFVLRVGDPVVNGYISGISKTELQIVQNAFGESQSMSIKLQPKEGDQNAARN